MISIIHDSHSLEFRKPYGAVPFGTASCICLEVYDDNLCADFIFKTAKVVFYGNILDKSENNIKTYKEIFLKCEGFEEVDTEYGRRKKYRFEAEFEADGPGVYFYYFELVQNDGTKHIYGDNDDFFGGIGRKYYYGEKVNGFQLTVYKAGLTVPEWFNHGIIYQIFPDRFYRANDPMSQFKPNTFVYGSWDDKPMYIKAPNGDIARWDFFGGNLMGVAQKMDYIEYLGANIIYLNPIFEASSNHRYDTCDYKHVDSLLGGDTAFELMTAVGKSRGFRFMLDGVFSHTGNDSIYFDAYGKYGTGAYHHEDSPYRNWYRFSKESDDEYECWWGCKALPNVEEMCPSYVDYIIEDPDSVISHWIKKGASGWRLDVADELPDEFIKKLRTAATHAAEEIGAEQPVILGEVWEDATNKISYEKMRMYFTDGELHTVTNYLFRKYMFEFFSGEVNGATTGKRFKSLDENCPKHNFYALANMTGSHDVERLMTYMLRISGGHREKARSMISAYAAMMFTFPGVPVVYYGDETCLEGGTDPDNRRTYPWGKQDVEMIDWFASLAKMRKTYSALGSGFWRTLKCSRDKECDVCGGSDLFAVERSFKDGKDAFGKNVSDVTSEKQKSDTVLCVIRNSSYNTVQDEGDTIYIHGLKPMQKFGVIADSMTGPMAQSMVSENPDELFGQILMFTAADENGTLCIENMKQLMILTEI